MFESTKAKLLLGVYVFMLLSIPVGAYLASQSQNPFTKASAPAKSPLPSLVPLKNSIDIKQLTAPAGSALPSNALEATDSAAATTYGPTLNLKVNLEGRPIGNQAVKLFVGIVDATATTLKYLLSFTVDVPGSGAFSGISLSGLDVGSNYKAILKGPAQLATSSAFVMGPSVTLLNGGNTITLLSGDLNEDNVVNTADYSIMKTAFGKKSTDSDWNENIDLNKDGVINAIDLGLVIKNFGKTGDSGVWGSPVPPAATSSGSISPTGATELEQATPAGTLNSGQSGYWFWMPKLTE
jgi:hypothetical protein